MGGLFPLFCFGWASIWCFLELDDVNKRQVWRVMRSRWCFSQSFVLHVMESKMIFCCGDQDTKACVSHSTLPGLMPSRESPHLSLWGLCGLHAVSWDFCSYNLYGLLPNELWNHLTPRWRRASLAASRARLYSLARSWASLFKSSGCQKPLMTLEPSWVISRRNTE